MEAILESEAYGHEIFEDFGADYLLPFPAKVLARVESSKQAELRDLVRNYAPKSPGCYGMIDAVGRLIYVGKSKYLRSRLLSYFMPNHEDEKAGRIIQATHCVVWETQPSEFAALLREQQLIRMFKPRFNVVGIPNRQKSLFLCLGRSTAAMFYVANEADSQAIAWEGPLMGAGRVRRAAEILNRGFKLRDCSNQTTMLFLDQRQLFDLEARAVCVRHEMQTCLGPCAYGCSRRDYQNQVDAARGFLKGDSTGLVDELEKRMQLAAERLHYEQAARFREDHLVMKWLVKRLEDHARVRNRLTCIYPVKGIDGRDVWYFIRRGVVEHAIRAPKTKRGEPKAAQEVQRWLDSDNSIGTRYQRREETLAIVAGWFRKNPDEQKELLLPKELLATQF
jgi:excinuclease ABC subunit C